jgi:hypothetical protein
LLFLKLTLKEVDVKKRRNIHRRDRRERREKMMQRFGKRKRLDGEGRKRFMMD